MSLHWVKYPAETALQGKCLVCYTKLVYIYIYDVTLKSVKS